jgi:hypothetical protein
MEVSMGLVGAEGCRKIESKQKRTKVSRLTQQTHLLSEINTITGEKMILKKT